MIDSLRGFSLKKTYDQKYDFNYEEEEGCLPVQENNPHEKNLRKKQDRKEETLKEIFEGTLLFSEDPEDDNILSYVKEASSPEISPSTPFHFFQERESKLHEVYDRNVQVLLNSPSSGLPSTILLPLSTVKKKSETR